MMSATSITFTLTLCSLICQTTGNAFLAKGPQKDQALNQTAVEQRFLEEVRGFMGDTKAHGLPLIQKQLEPMWHALPKNQHGKLDSPQVRYALHRFFVQRHGWHIDGLDRNGDIMDASSSSATSLLRQRVPTFLMDLFEEAFGQSGLMLHELAIFAATLEHMIHDETTERLKDVYKAINRSTTTRLSSADVDQALKIFMMSLILGQEQLSSDELVQSSMSKLERTYPGWSDAQLWLRDVQETTSYIDHSATNPFKNPYIDHGLKFSQMERIASEVSDRLGSYQDIECRQLKDMLLEREDRDTGRLLLSDFYKKGMQTSMQFVEKPDYLRQLGALDETRPGEPRVIVANYVLSTTNCLADMGFYSICCVNECESLMANLERKIAAPQASPKMIAAVVANLSTSTVEAPGILSAKMIRRLDEVAIRNGGRVPLHGRLFAQWLHLVFPRECPYPHTSGSRSPLSASEWLEANPGNLNMKRKEIRQYIDRAHENGQAGDNDASGEEDFTQWSHEEEILYLPAQLAAGWETKLLRASLVLVVLGIGAAAVVDAGQRAGLEVCQGVEQKAHLV